MEVGGAAACFPGWGPVQHQTGDLIQGVLQVAEKADTEP